jgi:signal transduction histidine kinase
LTNSVNEIKELAEQLKSKPESVTVQSSSVGQVGEQVFIPVLVEDVVNQKQIEYGNRPEIQISFVNELNDSDVFSKASGIDLRSVISNLVNNAVESYGEAGGSITVVLSASDRMCTISVIDQGCGVSTENMNKLGQSCFTSKFGGDGGLGLVHATQTANSWGGRVRIQSEVEVGTRVTLEIPRNERSGLLRRIVETVAR